jgi:hypothetical protein
MATRPATRPAITTAPADPPGLISNVAKALGLTAKDAAGILDVPTIGTLYTDAKDAVSTVYTDGGEKISSVGIEIKNTKNQAVETVQYSIVLLFILTGSGILLYGPQIFSAWEALYERIKANGVAINFSL